MYISFIGRRAGHAEFFYSLPVLIFELLCNHWMG